MSRLVPKQRQLTETETSTSFESWRESMLFHISLDSKFSRYLDDLKTWNTTVNRGYNDDPESVTADKKMTAVQKSITL